MKLQKNTNNLIGKKTKQRKRLAAIAGLSLVTGMILTEVSSLNVYAQTDDVLKVEQPAANKVQIQGKNGTCTWTLYDNGEMHVSAGELGPGQISSVMRDPSAPDSPVDGVNNTKASGTNKIIFDGKVVANKDSHELFKDLKNLGSIENIQNLDMSNVENIDNIFALTLSLKSLDLTSWNVSKVNSMENAFSDSGIQSLNVSNWDVSSVKNMDDMFVKTKLTSLDLSK
ncbi:BspA family leucine-rich repeat surface protein [Companilactobacillus crustorum]|uniref:BspA family leucine-rich repeat surface protein n=1 Tax=Companilactobacillus crustorum TaxID=392416 RepID=UPI000957ACE9|nr:BspA family leucine-rich repeat surface protein [Companilactobacillus crustorum]APU72150.1 hypothetical protein BI355_1851 [Companilactobacillus crustorum]